MRLFEELLNFIPEGLKESEDLRIVGDVVYVLLSDGNKIKISFDDPDTYHHWNAIRMQLININDTKIDNVLIRFKDVFGRQNVNGLPFDYHIWEYNHKLEWYGSKPTWHQIELMQDEIQSFYSVYEPFAVNNIL